MADIITVTESACRSHRNGDAQELQAKVINRVNNHDKFKDQNE